MPQKKLKNSKAIQRLEILVDKAITENWPMDRLAGLLSKPKKVDNYAGHSLWRNWNQKKSKTTKDDSGWLHMWI